MNINEGAMTNTGPIEWAFFKSELSLASLWENTWIGVGNNNLVLPAWSRTLNWFWKDWKGL